MKASELIEKLQELIKQHGDLETMVYITVSHHHEDIDIIEFDNKTQAKPIISIF